jgi:hypothetical protein
LSCQIVAASPECFDRTLFQVLCLGHERAAAFGFPGLLGDRDRKRAASRHVGLISRCKRTIQARHRRQRLTIEVTEYVEHAGEKLWHRSNSRQVFQIAE